MLGTQLVQKLQQLGISESESVCGSDVDWMFMGPDSAALSNFCSWFCENINSADVLTKEELQQYNKLEERKQVLHGSQLEAMADCLSSMSNITSTTAADGDYRGVVTMLGSGLDQEQEERRMQAELDKLDQQLERLNVRKDQLSVQQLSASSELDQLESALKTEKRTTAQHQTAALAAAQEQTTATATLADLTDRLANLMQGLAQDGSGFLMSTDLSPWLQEEQRYTQALKQFITKQFPQGSSLMVASSGGGDGGQHQLLEVGPEEMELVTGSGQAVYRQQTADLTRLHKLVQTCERDRVEEEVRVARHKAEAEEAGKALDRVKRGHYTASLHHNLQQETATLSSSLRVLCDETERQQMVVKGLVQQAAQRPTTATITGNYSTKRLRQQYYSTRQQQVLEMLVKQLSRVDYLSLLLQCEGETVSETLHQLTEATTLLILLHHTALSRTAYLTQLSHGIEEERALGKLPPNLVTLGKLVGAVATADQHNSATAADKCGAAAAVSVDQRSAAGNCSHLTTGSSSSSDVNDSSRMSGTGSVVIGGPSSSVISISEAIANMMTTSVADTDDAKQPEVVRLVSGVERCLQEREAAEQQLANLQHPHSHALTKLSGKCSLLEDCLSGGGSSGRLPGTLPASWLPPGLLDRQTDAQTQAYELRRAMMDLLKQFEYKKNVLHAQPDLAERLTSWRASKPIVPSK